MSRESLESESEERNVSQRGTDGIPDAAVALVSSSKERLELPGRRKNVPSVVSNDKGIVEGIEERWRRVITVSGSLPSRDCVNSEPPLNPRLRLNEHLSPWRHSSPNSHDKSTKTRSVLMGLSPCINLVQKGTPWWSDSITLSATYASSSHRQTIEDTMGSAELSPSAFRDSS